MCFNRVGWVLERCCVCGESAGGHISKGLNWKDLFGKMLCGLVEEAWATLFVAVE